MTAVDAPDTSETEPVEPSPAPTRPPRRWVVGFHAATWTRNIGLIVLLFIGYELWVTGFQEHRFQVTLRHQFDAAAGAPSSAPAKSGVAVARIQIPRLNLDQYVVQGTDSRNLEAGPGHYVFSPLPGQAGNVLISGHRTTFGSPFSHLDRLGVGDKIVASTPQHTYTYVVTGAPTVVSSANQSLLDTRAGNRLTLVTCTPRYAATDRLVVTAALVGPPTASGGPPLNPAGASEAAVGNSGWQWGAAPAAAAIAVGLIALGLAHGRLRRLYGRFGTLLILSPVWAAGLLLLFEHSRLLLPASL